MPCDQSAMVLGKVALVTGAGIGRATAQKFTDEGANVVVSDMDQPGGKETVSLINDLGGDATIIRADVSRRKDVERLIDETLTGYGRRDCACNNAGIEAKIAPLADQTIENFDAILGVNLRGTFPCLRAEIRQMLRNSAGSIVNLALIAGLVGFTGLSPYSASKHAVNGLTKNAALEYGKQGMRVNSVCPGGIDTRMPDALAEQFTSGAQSTREMINPLHPIGRIGTPEDVAELIVWLCSDRASFMSGANVSVAGGFVAQQ